MTRILSCPSLFSRYFSSQEIITARFAFERLCDQICSQLGSLWTTPHQYRPEVTIVTIFNKRPAASLITHHQIACTWYWICHIAYYYLKTQQIKGIKLYMFTVFNLFIIKMDSFFNII